MGRWDESIKIGDRFGRLVVLSEAKERPSAHDIRHWNCLCDCSSVRVLNTNVLRTGHTRSCGCLSRELTGKRALAAAIHGQARKKSQTSEYKSWAQMIQRCENPKSQDFPKYGGAGIKVCENWRESFVAFFNDMGPKPSPTHSIDRKDGKGHYEPGNCRWATKQEQSWNRPNVRIHEIHGVRGPLTYLCACFGQNYKTAYNRVHKHGWSIDMAVLTGATGAAP